MRNKRSYLLFFIFTIIFLYIILNFIIPNKEELIFNKQNGIIKNDEEKKDINLRDINEDYIFYINIENTYVNYPVVQSTNNYKYLTKAFDLTYSKYGTLFIDYRNTINDNRIFIYGHSSNTDNYFTLLNDIYYNKDTKQYQLTVIKNDVREVYKLFSIYTVSKYEDMQNYMNENFNDIKNKSKIRYIDANDNSNIITLYTCDLKNKDNRIIANFIKV